MKQPDAVPPGFWELFLQSNLTTLGLKRHLECVKSTRKRIPAAGTVRQWRLNLEEVNVSERQFGAGVAKGVEYTGLPFKLSHQTGYWFSILHCSNAFNMVKRVTVIKEVAIRASALTPFRRKCY